jgi:hypothetical protein
MVLYKICERYITLLVVYSIPQWLYNRLHNILYNIVCNMCLSIISTVIICWLTLLLAPLQRRRCPGRQASLVRSLRLCSASAKVTCSGWPLPYSHIKRWACTAYFCCPSQRWYDLQQLHSGCQIDEAGWACCFQPQSTASLAHDQACSQPCTDEGSCYISCYITPYVTWYIHTWGFCPLKQCPSRSKGQQQAFGRPL